MMVRGGGWCAAPSHLTPGICCLLLWTRGGCSNNTCLCICANAVSAPAAHYAGAAASASSPAACCRCCCNSRNAFAALTTASASRPGGSGRCPAGCVMAWRSRAPVLASASCHNRARVSLCQASWVGAASATPAHTWQQHPSCEERTHRGLERVLLAKHVEAGHAQHRLCAGRKQVRLLVRPAKLRAAKQQRKARRAFHRPWGAQACCKPR